MKVNGRGGDIQFELKRMFVDHEQKYQEENSLRGAFLYHKFQKVSRELKRQPFVVKLVVVEQRPDLETLGKSWSVTRCKLPKKFTTTKSPRQSSNLIKRRIPQQPFHKSEDTIAGGLLAKNLGSIS